MGRYSLTARRYAVHAAGALLVAGLGGCSTMEPLDQPYSWRPLGANHANVVAEVERPGDLVSGRPLGPSDGHEAADAVQRLRDNKLRDLASTQTSDATSGGSSGGGGGGGGD
ncbi:hypothetical protein [Gluconacetobacter takamatsuzukensis]|uniref:Uncharacterized protein n=1 Tax=Gluconacetobacter takamatsuzukensis TaxID=1286190 RepID=A0A7W4KD72_9PROT|nr:hypothetical protein [Gluconacetobacter takamatsuzukensis]MBB2204796.1 hypothetical protein [Gluconacetobacter takamatsuzukensis]